MKIEGMAETMQGEPPAPARADAQRMSDDSQKGGLDATHAQMQARMQAIIKPHIEEVHLHDAAPRQPQDNETAIEDHHKLDLTEDKLALEFGEAWASRDARYVPASGHWHIWSPERHWQRDEADVALAMSRQFLRRKVGDIRKWADDRARTMEPGKAQTLRKTVDRELADLRDLRKSRNVLTFAKTNLGAAARPDDFDPDPMMLGVPFAAVDLRSGKLIAAQREQMISRLATVRPEDDPPPIWREFLEAIFKSDIEMIAFVRRALGYSLTGETREHKLFFCYGTGANGKSTFLNILFYILGDYARRASVTTFLSRGNDTHPTDIAGLRGARLVITSEPPRGKTWDEGMVKDVTGGDVLTARFMHGDFFDFRPVLKLWIAGNTKPSFRGVDEAMRRRFVLIPFNVTIPPEERDPELPEKLQAEAGQIVNRHAKLTPYRRPKLTPLCCAEIRA